MGKPTKVLIVDDNPDFLFVMETFLQRNGFETLTAQTGEEGMNRIEKDPPDIIILDITMESFFSGFDVCKRVQGNPQLKHIPIIGVSGMGDNLRYFYDKGREEHFSPTCFFEKPVDKNLLLKKIQELLGRFNVGP